MIEVIDNVVDDHFCKFLVRKLGRDGKWALATDGEYSRQEIELSDNGFLFATFIKDHDEYDEPEFNILVEYILDSFLQKTKQSYEGIEISRFFFNYYNRESEGVSHTDHPEPNYQSLLINLNTNDGGTIVDGEFVKSESGRVIAFDSSIDHQGVGPTKDKQRFALNIVFHYDKRT